MNETWNQQFIYHLIEVVKEDLNQKDLSFFQKQFLKQQLNTLQQLIKGSTEKKYTYLDKEHILRKNVYKEYLQIPYWIKRTILKSIFLYEECEKDLIYKDLPRSFFSTKELLQEAFEYIEWFKYELFQQFVRKYFLEHNDFLQMNFQNPNYLGETITFFVRNHYYPFIRMNQKNTLEDVATLGHELFHAYYFKNQNEMENTYTWYLSELEGDLSDFLFSLYLQDKHVSSTIVKNIRNNYFVNGFSHLYSFYLCEKPFTK